jgi:hypothetical protein
MNNSEKKSSPFEVILIFFIFFEIIQEFLVRKKMDW